MSIWKHPFWDRLPEPVRADPKKSSLLAGLTVVMLVVGIRHFAGGTGPSPAKAAKASVAKVASSTSVPPRTAKARESDKTASAPGQRVADWLVTPIKALDRNLFETKLEYFQRLESAVEDKAAIVADELFWDQLAKSLASQADQKKQKQIRSENLQLAASSLRLQSTIMGAVPRAMIDGRMVRVGDVVETEAAGLAMSFRIVQIEARRIVVERGGVKIELPMGSGKARVLSE